MIPYNVELFSLDFEYRASAQVEYIDHEYDYLDITKAAVKSQGSITAKKVIGYILQETLLKRMGSYLI